MKLICLLFLMLIVASCNKDPEYYTLETPVDQMLLKASSSEITLEKEKENEAAVIFTWDAAAQRGGADATITYFFRMYMADLHSNVTDLYEIESEERSISFTHKELNDILASWSILPGDKVTIEAEVIGQVNSSVEYLKPELSKTQLDVIGYDKNATAIYMVMVDDAGEKTVRRMTEKVVGSGVYQSTAELKPCEYFFALSPDSDYPCYMKAENGDNSLQYVAEAGNGEMFENTKSGTYTIVVDLNRLDVNIVSIYPLPQGGIWIVGDASTIGWDWGKMKKEGAFVNNDPRHPERWTYTGNFYGGKEFKLALEPNGADFAGKFFFAPSQGANPGVEHELGEARYQDNGGDLKWIVAADGKYILTVDLNEMKIYLEPTE